MWSKINDKLYRIEINGELTDIKVPFGKVKALFSAFVASGGVIDEHGNIQTDFLTLMNAFGNVGDILLSRYGAKGEILEQGDCSELSGAEITELFTMASEIIENFIVAATAKKTPEAAQPQSAESEK